MKALKKSYTVPSINNLVAHSRSVCKGLEVI